MRLKEFIRKIAQLKKIDENFIKDSNYSLVLGKDVSSNLKEKSYALGNCSENISEAKELVKAYEN